MSSNKSGAILSLPQNFSLDVFSPFFWIGNAVSSSRYSIFSCLLFGQADEIFSLETVCVCVCGIFSSLALLVARLSIIYTYV